ncbi:MAG: PLP-dependent aminotransferase family protein [Oscillospiraceae bacterium]|nr:PLP-dependent aminotransferase family protein [Oscillospiraceae bacterium]
MTYDYIQLEKESGQPLYLQLYEQLKSAAQSGSIHPGQKLPSIRRLSEDLGLSRTTIENAYQQLCVEGYIDAQPQRGYFVLTSGGKRGVRPEEAVHPIPWQPRYNFGTDAVDSTCADLKAWRRHIREILNRPQAMVRYGEHQGELSLREALRDYSYGARGVVCSAEQVVIGAGTQPLLYILCGLMQGQVGAVAIEEPGFPQAEQVFADCGIEVLRLPGDDSGMRPEALQQSGAKVAYVTPSSREGNGSPIPLLRRQELLNWAAQTGGLLIEDDYNGELRYRARPIPAMQGMAADDRVLYLGSFSKLLLPSVRVGYMVLPQRLLPLYLARAPRYNQTASKAEQLALADYVKSGQLERQLRRLRKVYAQKSSLLMHLLQEAFGKCAQISLQETPLCVTLQFHGGPSPARLAELAETYGVRVCPGPEGKVTLGFAGIPMGDIAPGVHALQKAWNPPEFCISG